VGAFGAGALCACLQSGGIFIADTEEEKMGRGLGAEESEGWAKAWGCELMLALHVQGAFCGSFISEEISARAFWHWAVTIFEHA
jgi:hypothetical protein